MDVEISVRSMKYDDIDRICKADHDESERNKAYLRNQLMNQDKGECSALMALFGEEALLTGISENGGGRWEQGIFFMVKTSA